MHNSAQFRTQSPFFVQRCNLARKASKEGRCNQACSQSPFSVAGNCAVCTRNIISPPRASPPLLQCQGLTLTLPHPPKKKKKEPPSLLHGLLGAHSCSLPHWRESTIYVDVVPPTCYTDWSISCQAIARYCLARSESLPFRKKSPNKVHLLTRVGKIQWNCASPFNFSSTAAKSSHSFP